MVGVEINRGIISRSACYNSVKKTAFPVELCACETPPVSFKEKYRTNTNCWKEILTKIYGPKREEVIYVTFTG